VVNGSFVFQVIVNHVGNSNFVFNMLTITAFPQLISHLN